MTADAFDGLPEVMASLRAIGSARRTAALNDEVLRFFVPLLQARRKAAAARQASDVVASFDVTSILRDLDAVVRSIAQCRYPTRPPARRAFEAELTDALEPLRRALAHLGRLAPAAHASTQHDAAWGEWVAQLKVTFENADILWSRLGAVLSPSERAPFGDTGAGT